MQAHCGIRIAGTWPWGGTGHMVPAQTCCRVPTELGGLGVMGLSAHEAACAAGSRGAKERANQRQKHQEAHEMLQCSTDEQQPAAASVAHPATVLSFCESACIQECTGDSFPSDQQGKQHQGEPCIRRCFRGVCHTLPDSIWIYGDTTRAGTSAVGRAPVFGVMCTEQQQAHLRGGWWPPPGDGGSGKKETKNPTDLRA